MFDLWPYTVQIKNANGEWIDRAFSPTFKRAAKSAQDLQELGRETRILDRDKILVVNGPD